MTEITNLFSNRIHQLLQEADHLKPNQPVSFEIMKDETIMRRSAGAALISDELGRDVIFYDPVRIDEYKIAHEIMHVILHRSNWPQMFYMLPNLGLETWEERIADELDNIFDHYIFNPRLEKLGFDAQPYKEWCLSMFNEWTAVSIAGPSVLFNAFHVLDGLLWGSSHRQKVVNVVRQKQPQILALAQNLEKRIVRVKKPTEALTRFAMNDVLDFLNRWITKQSGENAELKKRIGVTPIIRSEEFKKPASRVIDLVSEPFYYKDRVFWLLAFELKTDHTRFHTICYPDEKFEPNSVKAIRQEWQVCDFESFFNLHGLGTKK